MYTKHRLKTFASTVTSFCSVVHTTMHNAVLPDELAPSRNVFHFTTFDSLYLVRPQYSSQHPLKPKLLHLQGVTPPFKAYLEVFSCGI